MTIIMAVCIIMSLRFAYCTVIDCLVFKDFREEIEATGNLSNRGDQLKRLQEIRNALDKFNLSHRYLFDLTRWRPQACLPEVYAMLKKP